MEEQGKVKGMFRVKIAENGKIVGDSGWHANQITNLGFNQYLVSLLGAIAGSKQVGYLALGTGTAPGAADTGLQGEVVKRQAITAATSSSSKTVRFTGTFSSGNSFVSDTQNIANIALVNNQNSSDAHTIFAGNTFNSSSCATNQDVYTTYDIIFS